MGKGINFNLLNEALQSAPMTELRSVMGLKNKLKKKLINIPIDWEDKIKAHYKGTINSYILMAIYERMQKDNIL